MTRMPGELSALSYAAHSGFGDLVAFFLELGADPNAAAAGFSALHAAVMRRDEKMASRAARPRGGRERAAPHLDADAALVERLQLRA